MKTAISLPDELFERAEATAKTLKVSRSELYARAISKYLETHDKEAITARLNEFYSVTPAKVDEAFHRAQLEVMKRSEW